MSIVTKQHASFPPALAAQPGPVAVPPHRGSVRSSRTDAPHVTGACARAPAAAVPLMWTTYVTPAIAPLAAQATSEVGAAAPNAHASVPGAAALPSRSRSALHGSALHGSVLHGSVLHGSVLHGSVLHGSEQSGRVQSGSTAVAPRVGRQRFYAAQWRRAVEPAIGRLLSPHGQRLQWIGWDRSLPRLYLPAEQLTEAVVDLLRLTLQWTEHRGGQGQAACLRVGWQIGATQTLVLVLAHPRLRLSAAALAATNAVHWPLTAIETQRSELEVLLRVQRSLRAMGGGLTASHSQEGGGLFRMSLPVDDRATLVRGWLDQLSRSFAHHARGPADLNLAAAPTPIRTQQIRMFAIGRMQAESIAGLAAADAQLQSRASRDDFVYRAAHGRWLWLTGADVLPGSLDDGEWRHQLVGRWNCPLGAADQQVADTATRLRVARAIVAAMEAALGRRVPPIDAFDVAPPRSRRLRIDRATELRSGHRALRPRVEPIGIRTAKAPAPALARQRRWRYPI